MVKKKIGIEERYPPTHESTIALMAVGFFVMSVSILAHQWNAWWFWPLLLFGGIPWVALVSNFFDTFSSRKAYNAAIDDVIGTVTPLCVEMVLMETKRPVKPQEFYREYKAALIRLRPNRMEEWPIY